MKREFSPGYGVFEKSQARGSDFRPVVEVKRDVPEVQEITPSREDNGQQQRKPSKAKNILPGFGFRIGKGGKNLFHN